MLNISLAWFASPSPNVAGYKIKTGSAPGVYDRVEDVGNVLTAKITDLDPAVPHYFAVTAFNAFGAESVPSNEVTDNVAPDAPFGLRITETETV